ncbi:MAG: cysteine--tRNA ligase, partial [Bacteroidales bacterium]|nr:cysteine--tRNA ligase [Bacteroidales bacterium]
VTLKKLKADKNAPPSDVDAISKACYEAMNDDFNSPMVIAALFDAVRLINAVSDGHITINENELDQLKKLVHDFVFDILGIQSEEAGSDLELVDGLMQTIINLRQEARTKKDFATSDVIRDSLGKLNIVLKDGKEGTSWEVK